MTRYGLRVGDFVRDYQADWVITAAPGGSGYCAQRRGSQGHGKGPKRCALTLDELAAQLEQADRDAAAGHRTPDRM